MQNRSTIIITGAASGIGNHMAKAMIKAGHQVVLCDINEAAMQADFGSCSEQQVLLRKLDVTSVENWQQIFEACEQQFGQLDYLFNIAGVIIPGFIHSTSFGELDAQIDINTKGMIYGAKIASETMVKQGHGHIINVASLAGLVPVTGIAGYTASKFAIRGFSLAIAGDLKPHNVSVSVICPDLVKTPMMEHELNYEEEVALIFTGSKTLSVEDIEQAFHDAMANKPLEIMLPYSRGLLSKVGSFFPKVNEVLSMRLARKGREAVRKEKQNAS